MARSHTHPQDSALTHELTPRSHSLRMDMAPLRPQPPHSVPLSISRRLKSVNPSPQSRCTRHILLAAQSSSPPRRCGAITVGSQYLPLLSLMSSTSVWTSSLLLPSRLPVLVAMSSSSHRRWSARLSSVVVCSQHVLWLWIYLFSQATNPNPKSLTANHRRWIYLPLMSTPNPKQLTLTLSP